VTPYWNPEEVALLHSLYPMSSREDILRALPGRTWPSIKSKACLLHIPRNAHKESLPDKVWFYYRANPDRTMKHIAQKFDRSIGSISKMLTKKLSNR
jgi:hypothetical protein